MKNYNGTRMRLKVEAINEHSLWWSINLINFLKKSLPTISQLYFQWDDSSNGKKKTDGEMWVTVTLINLKPKIVKEFTN